jgi:gamma-glutamylcyclotransferase (GGCT)/AIG2-like uncharacterized protein YtfP
MTTPDRGARREILLFVCDCLMSGLSDHARLAGTRSLGAAATEPKFDLVEVGNEAGLVLGGTTSVRGELYAIEPSQLASIDVQRGHPLRYRRQPVRLDDGREAEAYTLDADQVRGRRRIKGGDYRGHVEPAAPVRRDSAWARWARSRGGNPGAR